MHRAFQVIDSAMESHHCGHFLNKVGSMCAKDVGT